MADAVLTRRESTGWRHPAVRIAVVYAAARVVTTLFFLLAGAMSTESSRHGVAPGLGTLVLGWDATWYWLIAEQGYPTDLPLDAEGHVAENAWAFMPIFPFVAKVVGLPFGAWGAGAFLVALAAGYGCCLALYALLRDRIGSAAASWSVVLFASAPLAAMLQVGYAESLFLLWLLLALVCVQRRRWVWLYGLIPLMAFTRPGVLAFALFLGLYGVYRIVIRRREALSRREVVHGVALAALATVTGFAWQVIASIATGDPSAYLATELAWRRPWVGGEDDGFTPFLGWFQGAQIWFTQWGLGATTGVVAALLAIAVVAALLIWEPHVRRLGVEVRLWTAAYLVYLLAVFFPQSSIFRLLFPISPLWGALAVPRSPVWRAAVLGACLVGQWWWIWNMYGLGNQYWQIP